MEKKKRTKNVYTEEFKNQAVQLALKIGRKNACSELGVSASAMARWKNEFSPNPAQKNESAKLSYEELEAENRKLKKELGYISEINNILKKSTAIFTHDLMKNLK